MVRVTQPQRNCRGDDAVRVELEEVPPVLEEVGEVQRGEAYGGGGMAKRFCKAAAWYTHET